jgi:hypothetical protein
MLAGLRCAQSSALPLLDSWERRAQLHLLLGGAPTGLYGLPAGSNNSMRLPEGSSRRTWLPPMPLIKSLRK